MSKSTRLLLGDEAVALAAVHAGIGGAYSYAGTPATEIFEAIESFAPEVWAHWSANEKVAYEEALGMSYAGKRALVSMKHVGLNVAADPFMSSSLTGVNGGVVLVVADDPGMHSSQGEQDSRFFAEFAKIPCFEPSTQQECYDMTREAFRRSEEWGLPVMLRIVTRLAHSRGRIKYCEDELEIARRGTRLPLPDPNDWTLIPANARRRYKRLLAAQQILQGYTDASPYNRLTLKGKRGIVCTSTAYNYVREALGPEPVDSLLRVGVYPLPVEPLRELVEHCDEIVVIEEGYPLIEQHLTGFAGIPGKTIRGKLEGSLPLDGELLPDVVAAALGLKPQPGLPVDSLVPGRPPQFCKGCPHADTFNAILDATAEYDHPLIFGDIGCYAMAVMPPFQSIHSAVDMGASIGLAHGASRAGHHPVLCTIGDSTFAHSGMTPLLGAVLTNANITVLIMDNATTAMTGTQDSMATGDQLIEILKGLGVQDLHTFDPLPRNRAANRDMLKQAIAHEGLSVIVAKRACIQIKPSKLVSSIPVEAGN